MSGVGKSGCKRLTCAWGLAFSLLSIVFSSSANASILEEHPALRKHLFVEPASDLYLGFSVSPIGVLESKAVHMLGLVQFHWIRGIADVELMSVHVGTTSISKTDFAGSRHFLFRSSPKLRIFDFLSVGPLVGFEFISFPKIGVSLAKGGFSTPVEPFSAKGWILGALISETFAFQEKYLLKINQSVYWQHYSTVQTDDGWRYRFDKAEIEGDRDRTIIKPSYVAMLEICLLY